MSINVLCLPGGLGTAAFFDDIAAAPALAAGGVRVVAVTLPGFGGVPLPAGFDSTLEAYAAHAADLAREHDCAAVAGHSFGANIALEMAALGHFDAHSSSYPLLGGGRSEGTRDVQPAATCRASAHSSPRRCSRVSRRCWRRWRFPSTASRRSPPRWRRTTAWTSASTCAATTSTSAATGRSPHGCASQVFRQTSSSARTTRSASRPEKRSILESCATTRLHVAPDAGHMLINQQPDWIAELIVGAVSG